jgi:hypothetical protein
MLRFKSAGSAQKFLSNQAVLRNTFNVHDRRHLSTPGMTLRALWAPPNIGALTVAASPRCESFDQFGRQIEAGRSGG